MQPTISELAPNPTSGPLSPGDRVEDIDNDGNPTGNRGVVLTDGRTLFVLVTEDRFGMKWSLDSPLPLRLQVGARTWIHGRRLDGNRNVRDTLSKVIILRENDGWNWVKTS